LLNFICKGEDIFYIDLIILVGYKLFLFEIKSGTKEKKARKQFAFHKKAFFNAQKKGLFFKNCLACSLVNKLANFTSPLLDIFSFLFISITRISKIS